MSDTPGKVILVTGATRGIGLAIIQSLAQHSDTRDSTLLLGCRTLSSGQEAVGTLGQTHPDIDTSRIHAVVIDVLDDSSIRRAAEYIRTTHGAALDVLVNNAGVAVRSSTTDDDNEVRGAWAATLAVNVTSVYMATRALMPLLRGAVRPKVINVSSGRASLVRAAGGLLPPTAVVAYSVSKTALSAVTVEMSREVGSEGVEFQAVNPGHCRTAFNGFKGTREPAEGADVVVELIRAGDRRKTGFWETVGSDRVLREVPW